MNEKEGISLWDFMQWLNPRLEVPEEAMRCELGEYAMIFWKASLWDQPQFDCGLMYWQHKEAGCDHE